LGFYHDPEDYKQPSESLKKLEKMFEEAMKEARKDRN